jgi:hypothetical protein
VLCEQQTLPGALTRGQWLRVVADYRQCNWSSRHPRERRKSRRDRIPALATITFKSAANSERRTVYSNCPVLDVSDDGLAARCYRKIEAGTAVSLEVKVGGTRSRLTGRVMHSSGFPGSVRVGIALSFAEGGDQEESGG